MLLVHWATIISEYPLPVYDTLQVLAAVKQFLDSTYPTDVHEMPASLTCKLALAPSSFMHSVERRSSGLALLA